MSARGRMASRGLLLASLATLLWASSAQAATPPVLTIEDASQITATSAHLSGTVDPAGAEASCRFEVVPDASFQESGFEHAALRGTGGVVKDCAPDPVKGEGPQPVSAQVALRANTLYHFRLVAQNEAGGSTLEGKPFTTPIGPPGALTGPNTPEAGGKVRLSGYVDPQEMPVSACKFLYGPQAGNYTSEAPCANHPGNEVQALLVGATGGQFRLSLPEFNGTTGTGDLTAGSNLITNVTTSTGEFRVGQVLRNEGDGASGLRGVPDIIAVGPGTLETDTAAKTTKTTTPLQSERLEITADLPFDASAAEVQAALEALPRIGAGGVAVEEAAGGQGFHLYLVSFQGALADRNVEELRAESGTVALSGNSEDPVLTYSETLIPGGLTEPHEVYAALSGLTPGATYHYRLVAETAAGKTESPDATFRAAAEPATAPCPNAGAPGVGSLPECRAWEMVSPPQKNGGDALAVTRVTRVAGDGSAASWGSYSPFGDASGAGVASQYESIRTASGWQTHGILPPQPQTTFLAVGNELEPRYSGDFSTDLNSGVFLAWRPLDHSDPNVEEVENLYLRTDLRSAGEGHYRLLTRCPLCAEEKKKLEGISQELEPHFVAASEGFHHVLFGSTFNLVKPANSVGQKLYEDEEGTLRLAGILPDGKAASESLPPFEGRNTPRSISADGSKVFFSDGSTLYMRLNHETTVKLNESELAEPEAPKPAQFNEISADGSKVFFTSAERLTEDAPPSQNSALLYAYDTTKPPSAHNLTYIGEDSGGVLGADAGGDTVYFVGGQYAFYAWHEGKLRYLLEAQSYRYDGDQNHHFPSRVAANGTLLFGADRLLGGPGEAFSGYCPASTNKGCEQFFTYDPATEALQCVSCGSRAAQRVGSEIEAEQNNALGLQPRRNHPLTADGRHVFFTTDAALVPQDTNGTRDVYSYDTETARASLISSGTNPNPSYFMEATPSGSDAFFTTRAPLSGWDIDSNEDLYDARLEGGLPEPRASAASCEGEACLLGPGAPPSPGAMSSEAISGSGPPPSCPRGTRQVRKGGSVRCVKKKRHRRHRRRGAGR